MKALIRPLLLISLLLVAAPAPALVSVAIDTAPPALPSYPQPVCPGEGYLWMPGYWAYAEAGYYWVPGTWVMPPVAGYLWTPGWWGWSSGGYAFHPGYWGPHVGFYGGINYGYGYVGRGYVGGRWEDGQFLYNRAANNVDPKRVRHTYVAAIVRTTPVNRLSYNGGAHGTSARPTLGEDASEYERHVEPTAEQLRHEQAALTQRAQFASINAGRPPLAATPRPETFTHLDAAYRSEVTAGNASIQPPRVPQRAAPPPRSFAQLQEEALARREAQQRLEAEANQCLLSVARTESSRRARTQEYAARAEAHDRTPRVKSPAELESKPDRARKPVSP